MHFCTPRKYTHSIIACKILSQPPTDEVQHVFMLSDSLHGSGTTLLGLNKPTTEHNWQVTQLHLFRLLYKVKIAHAPLDLLELAECNTCRDVTPSIDCMCVYPLWGLIYVSFATLIISRQRHPQDEQEDCGSFSDLDTGGLPGS